MMDERIERVFDTGAEAQVNVENVHGAVVVEAWDQPQVHIVAVRRGEEAQVIIEGEGAWVNARTETDRETGFFGWGGKETQAEVEYMLRVPRATRLTAKTVKGPVQVSGLRGTVEVSSVHGPVVVTDCEGAVRAQATNGHVELSQVAGQVEVYTANGGIAVRGGQAQSLTAETVNGVISVGPLASGSDIRARTVNGELALTLASGVAAELEATGVMLRTHFETPNQPATTGRGGWRGVVGDGQPSAHVTYSTVNGTLVVRGDGVATTTATVASAAWQPAAPPPPPPPPPTAPPPPPAAAARPKTNMEILAAVDRGEISVEEAVKLMSGTNP